MEPVAHDTWLIIADGSADYADGQRKLAEIERRVFPMRLARGYPALVDSAEFPGLKPGFNVVVIGACADKEEADLRLELLRAVAPGGYLRRVVSQDACPEVDRAPVKVSSGPVLGSWPIGGASTAHMDFRRPSDPGCPNAAGLVELRLPDQTLVSTLVLPGSCGDSGVRWDLPKPVTLDGTTLLAVRAWAQSPTGEVPGDFLYGFGCGQWRRFLGPLSGAQAHRFENVAPGRLRVSGGSGGASTFAVDPAQCVAVPESELTLE